MSAQPEALRLAELLEDCAGGPLDIASAAELRRLHAVNAQMLEALEWAKRQGFVKYYHRNKTNGEFCDAVDRFDAAIAAAKEQA